MVKLMGLGDLAGAALLVGTALNYDFPRGLIIGISVYLFFKALIFFFDIGSIFDIAAGILLILSLSMVLPSMVLFVLAGFLGIKAFLSLLA